MKSSREKEQDRYFRGRVTRRVLRMAVNLITCFGAGIATYSIVLAFQDNLRAAWIGIVLAVAIDGLDGTLIRTFRLQALCPGFDGTRLDEYADLVMFVIAPILIMFAGEQLPANKWGIITMLAVVGGSCLQFSYRQAKTSKVFWGFPAYWNIIYFYAWALGTTPEYVIGLSWILTTCLFLPIPFVYPTRTPYFRGLTLSLGFTWAIILLWFLWNPGLSMVWIYGSLAYPFYYIVISIWLYPRLKH